MWQKWNEDRYYLLTGHVAFLLYLFFTIIYYRERMLNCDAAYYTFHVVNHVEVFVKHQRYISYFTQWAPLLLIKFGAPLKAVIMSYSAVFGWWFYGMFILTAHGWKNPKGGIYLALALFLSMRYKHYAGHTEITFAIAVASLLIIWLTTDKNKLLWYSQRADFIIKGLLIAWLYIIHPIIIVPLAIVLAADMVYYHRWKQKLHWAFLIILLLSFILRFLTVAQDSYESGKIGLLASAWKVLTHPGDYYVYEMSIRYLTHEYIPPLLIFILVVIWIWNFRSKWTAVILVAGSVALTGLVIITYSYLRGDIFVMIDGYFGMLGMVWGFGIYLILRERVLQKWHIIVLGILMAYCMGRTWEKHYLLERRLEEYGKTMNMYPDEPKLFAPLSLHDWNKFWYPYETPLETLMLSCLESPDNARTIFIDYDDRGPGDMLDESGYFLNFYNKTPVRHLNQKYFRLSDQHTYSIIDSVSWK